MFRVILWSEWKWSRLAITLGTIAGFGLPMVSLRGALSGDPAEKPAELLRAVQAWGTLYPALAGTLGLLMAIAAWAPDHRGRHVLALSLPIPRWRYVLLRFGAGMTLLSLPIAAVLVSGLIATGTASLPEGLHGYPVALAVRFALAVLVAFSLFFAISGSTARTAGIILGTIGGLIVITILAGVAGVNVEFLGRIPAAVFDWPGPFAIFAGRWMLIDV
ncbi:MAG TPA: hypothetical protein VMG41_06475 [Gemmatimonadales bacterium]|nr:hypothetical protein [Gemmatimonadales bacterium]